MADAAGTEEKPGGESRGTVIVALFANIAVAVGKTAAGVIGGSGAMLSEAAHSWADTTNQLFLLTSLRRSARPADSVHPFGYGKERFFWSLLAAVAIFVTGGCFSVFQGIESISEGHQEISFAEMMLSLGVLAFALVLEGSSLLRALRQLRGEAAAAERGMAEQARKTKDPALKTVVSEDSAAVVGILLAAGGVVLHRLTGNAVYDGAASLAIGLVLVFVAYRLGRDNKEAIIGEAADPEMRLDMIGEVAGFPEVDAVLDLLTMQMGPDQLLVALKVDFRDDISGGDVENASTRIDERLRERFPTVAQVFVDATTATDDERVRVDTIAELVAADEAGDDGVDERFASLDRPL